MLKAKRRRSLRISQKNLGLKAKKGGPLNISQKLDLIKAVEEGVKTQTVLASEFGVSKSCVTHTLRKKEELMAACNNGECSPLRKRIRKSAYTDVEDALLLWLKQSVQEKVPITGPALMKKAKEIANGLGYSQFPSSTSWLTRFKDRHMITVRNNTCEVGINGTNADAVTNKWVAAHLPTSLCMFSLDEIYVARLCGLYWKCLPGDTASLRNEKCPEGEKPEDRLMTLLCSNMTGTCKLPLLVVGNSRKPDRCFNYYDANVVHYGANPRSWITGDIFVEWLQEVDQEFAKDQRKIALIVDHYIVPPRDSFKLEAVKLVYLSPTSLLQSSGSGMITEFKAYYRRYLLLDLMVALDFEQKYNLQLVDVLFLLGSAWNQVSTSTISRGFASCGFSQSQREDNLSKGDGISIPHLIDGTRLLKGAGVSDLSFEDYISVDNGLSTSDQSSRVTKCEQEKGKDNEKEGELTPFTGLQEEDLTVSVAEVDQSLKVLRKFVLALGKGGEGGSLVARLGQLVSETILTSVVQSID